MKTTQMQRTSTNLPRPALKAGIGNRLSALASFRLAGSLLALWLAAGAACAQSTDIPGPSDYARFSHFITDRNIFNPDRQPHTYNRNSTYRSYRTSRPRAGTPGIQFVGTMNYEKGMFAFFGGNSADLSQVLQVGGKIAGYTITEIAQDAVRLEAADKKEQTLLKVGSGFRQENGKWLLAAPGEIPAASSGTETAGSSGSDSSGSAPAAPTSAGEPNDILKRLMQQREKENK